MLEPSSHILGTKIALKTIYAKCYPVFCNIFNGNRLLANRLQQLTDSRIQVLNGFAAGIQFVVTVHKEQRR